MKYKGGTDLGPGDLIQIDLRYSGRVIASMDTGKYLPGEEGWAYLVHGVMIDTDFAGLVHYTTETADDFVPIERGPSI